jgi:LysM repeat protein
LSPLAKGASVFALSRKGANSATSRFAQALADRENKSDLLGGVDNSFGKDLQLNNILADMVVEGTVTQSLHMGSSILKEMGDLTKLHSKRVEQAGFAVLKEAGMISLLVETGFMTNAEEEAKLIQPSYQQQMAEAVFTGLRRFVQKYPMPQTYFAVGKEQKNRKIRDKVLQEIAPSAPKPINNQPEKLLDKPIDNKAIINSFNQELEPTKVKPVDDKVVKQPEKTADSKPMVKATLPSSLDEFMAGSMTTTTPVAKEVKPEKPVVKANVKSTHHVVEKVDSLSSIAVRYQLSMDDLKTWNQLKNDNAVLGQRLRLTAPENVNPKKASSQETSIKTTQVTKTEKTETKVVAKTHKVKVGDSLSSIATKYGVSPQAIKDLNKLKDDNVVLDKTLKIPTP